jgi:hypothetical protein
LKRLHRKGSSTGQVVGLHEQRPYLTIFKLNGAHEVLAL